MDKGLTEGVLQDMLDLEVLGILGSNPIPEKSSKR